MNVQIWCFCKVLTNIVIGESLLERNWRENPALVSGIATGSVKPETKSDKVNLKWFLFCSKREKLTKK